MNSALQLHDLGQSLWLDNITRELLTSGTLERYISEYAVTGLTSNPTIFDHAIRNNDYYDAAIREKTQAGKASEEMFFELALEDLTQAADLFYPTYAATAGMDGWERSGEIGEIGVERSQCALGEIGVRVKIQCALMVFAVP